MSKKFFSLIQGNPIHIAPNTKVIPHNEIAMLLDGQEALAQIQKDAEKYREEVARDCETLKEQAQKEGYEEGFKAWLEHIKKLEDEITNVRTEVQKMIVPIAMAAAKKIIGREIDQKEDAIVDIVSVSLKPVSTHKKITIYVNKKDLEILEKNKPKLKALFEVLEAFTLKERPDLSQGSCIIETEGGIINAKIENQWRTLEKAFDQLIKTKTG
ncbi:MAG: HrpE/YscL family type III secretion apparatus protein [Parachlamydiaceae bacterium]